MRRRTKEVEQTIQNMARQERTSIAYKGEIREMTYFPNVKEKYVNTAEFQKTEDGYHKYVPKKAINRYYKGIVENDEIVKGFECGIHLALEAIVASINDEIDIGKLWNQIRDEIKQEYAEEIKEQLNHSYNEFVVSVIEGLDDDEYNKRMKDIYGEEWEAEQKDEEEQINSFRALVESESKLEL